MSKSRAMLAERIIPIAAELACMVRDRDQCGITTRLGSLDRQELYALAVVLAAMVPDDRPVGDLLDWADGSREAQLRRAHSEATASRRAGLEVPAPVLADERVYVRNRYRRRSATRRAAA